VTLKKIDEQWRQLGKEPDIGDIAWFKSPD
jgi:hypothetical protein